MSAQTNSRFTTGAADPLHQASPLAVECLYDDDCKTLMVRGHYSHELFLAACERWNGGPLVGWGKVRHVWLRNTPDSSGDYEFRVWPAEPHSRGAYPATTIVDDPAYDHEADADSKTPNDTVEPREASARTRG